MRPCTKTKKEKQVFLLRIVILWDIFFQKSKLPLACHPWDYTAGRFISVFSKLFRWPNESHSSRRLLV
jgi:hypothetical protein